MPKNTCNPFAGMNCDFEEGISNDNESPDLVNNPYTERVSEEDKAFAQMKYLISSINRLWDQPNVNFSPKEKTYCSFFVRFVRYI